MHEHVLAGLEPAARAHCVVRGHEHLGYPARGEEVERVGHRRAVRGGDDDVLGLRAAADDAAHRGTGCGRRDSGADALDHAGELHAGDVGGDPGRRRIEASPLDEVGPVDAGAVDPDEHLTGARFGDRPLLDRQGAVARCDHGPHHGDRTRRPRSGAGLPVGR